MLKFQVSHAWHLWFSQPLLLFVSLHLPDHYQIRHRGCSRELDSILASGQGPLQSTVFRVGCVLEHVVVLFRKWNRLPRVGNCI